MAWKHILKYRGPQNESSSGYGIPKFVIEAIMEDNKDQLDSDDWNDYDLITDWFGTPKLEMDVYNGYEIKLTASTTRPITFHSYSKYDVKLDKIAEFYWKDSDDNSAGDIILEIDDKLPIGKDFDLEWQIEDYNNKKLIILVTVHEQGG